MKFTGSVPDGFALFGNKLPFFVSGPAKVKHQPEERPKRRWGNPLLCRGIRRHEEAETFGTLV